MNPKYPIYVISKGRWDSRSTVKYLTKMRVPYYIVIEEQEYANYAQYIDPNNILVLPFSNQGTSVPARNWVWQHSIDSGYEKHWILDDNIEAFMRKNRNTRIKVLTGTPFRIIEDFTDRYENIALSGMNYSNFAPDGMKQPPFYKNTRIYSCILVNNSIPFSWRGKMNEDTDLSLQAMKNNYTTVLFNSFLCMKRGTQWKKGGNTDELYKNTNNRYEFVKELQDRHPDVVRLVWRYGRWHHEVNYLPFKTTPLVPKKNLELNDIDNYGLKMIRLNEPILLGK